MRRFFADLALSPQEVVGLKNRIHQAFHRLERFRKAVDNAKRCLRKDPIKLKDVLLHDNRMNWWAFGIPLLQFAVNILNLNLN